MTEREGFGNYESSKSSMKRSIYGSVDLWHKDRFEGLSPTRPPQRKAGERTCLEGGDRRRFRGVVQGQGVKDQIGVKASEVYHFVYMGSFKFLIDSEGSRI